MFRRSKKKWCNKLSPTKLPFWYPRGEEEGLSILLWGLKNWGANFKPAACVRFSMNLCNTPGELGSAIQTRLPLMSNVPTRWRDSQFYSTRLKEYCFIIFEVLYASPYKKYIIIAMQLIIYYWRVTQKWQTSRAHGDLIFFLHCVRFMPLPREGCIRLIRSLKVLLQNAVHLENTLPPHL